ncbi:ABC transporter ATP-binding protein [Anaeromicropila herbilytica]|uniref:ATPase n=1 Tax=Anaeromicropila herbilytica TaxID=2785025 RepID=A0A7R7IEL3_9FIRM|nr:ABC transporter ATP-binding protein [Anaeromicropila herbilytica]BCN31223.1 ATPase [Anaeromicropila herbilytica]
MNRDNILIRYLKQYKWRYIGGIITLFIVDILNLYIPQFTGDLTDGLQNHTLDMNGIFHIILNILLVGFTLTIGRFLWRFFIFGSARKIEYHIRNDIFGHLEKLSLRYFNENKTGDLMAHCTNDLNAVRMSIGPGVITTFDAIIMTIMVLVKMITHISLSLTLLAVIPLSTIAIGGFFYGKAIEHRFTEKQEAFSELTDKVQESISGIRVIKAFVRERYELKDFAKSSKKNMDKSMQVVKLQAVVMPLLDVIIGLSSVITLLYGGYLTITGRISLGRFIAFNQYIGMLVWPMLAAGDSITIISQGFASLKRIENIFSEVPDIIDFPTVKQVDKLNGKIELRNVSFTYPNKDIKALDHVNVTIEQGQTLAILGRTGSGKTTIANLLLRMYNIDSNSILIDDKDINDLPLKTLREGIAYVPQDNFLFSETLQNNIAFGANTNDIDEVIASAKAACIHDNIMDFPENYETEVGERGVTLSGGQKQRTSIARALMKNAPILILDDALSAVDTNTEEQILENLKTNRKDKTTIIIAHRISTIQNADHILVLEEGKQAEYGTHEQLMNQYGIYRHMYEKQQLEKQISES